MQRDEFGGMQRKMLLKQIAADCDRISRRTSYLESREMMKECYSVLIK